MNQPSHDPKGAQVPARVPWAPDWRTLKKARDKAIVNIRYANDDQFNEAAYGAIVDEIQRQAAAAGLIMAPRETLKYLVKRYGGFRDNKHYLEARDILTATPELTPGGDEG